MKNIIKGCFKIYEITKPALVFLFELFLFFSLLISVIFSIHSSSINDILNGDNKLQWWNPGDMIKLASEQLIENREPRNIGSLHFLPNSKENYFHLIIVDQSRSASYKTKKKLQSEIQSRPEEEKTRTALCKMVNHNSENYLKDNRLLFTNALLKSLCHKNNNSGNIASVIVYDGGDGGENNWKNLFSFYHNPNPANWDDLSIPLDTNSTKYQEFISSIYSRLINYNNLNTNSNSKTNFREVFNFLTATFGNHSSEFEGKSIVLTILSDFEDDSKTTNAEKESALRAFGEKFENIHQINLVKFPRIKDLGKRSPSVLYEYESENNDISKMLKLLRENFTPKIREYSWVDLTNLVSNEKKAKLSKSLSSYLSLILAQNFDPSLGNQNNTIDTSKIVFRYSGNPIKSDAYLSFDSVDVNKEIYMNLIPLEDITSALWIEYTLVPNKSDQPLRSKRRLLPGKPLKETIKLNEQLKLSLFNPAYNFQKNMGLEIYFSDENHKTFYAFEYRERLSSFSSELLIVSCLGILLVFYALILLLFGGLVWVWPNNIRIENWIGWWLGGVVLGIPLICIIEYWLASYIYILIYCVATIILILSRHLVVLNLKKNTNVEGTTVYTDEKISSSRKLFFYLIGLVFLIIVISIRLDTIFYSVVSNVPNFKEEILLVSFVFPLVSISIFLFLYGVFNEKKGEKEETIN